MRRPSLPALLFALLTVVIITAGVATDDARSALDAARSAWDAGGSSDYDLVLERRCFCAEDYRGPFLVHVRNGSVNSATFMGGSGRANEAVSEQIRAGLPTVDGLFEIVQGAIDGGPHRLEVVYDANFAFPARIEIDTSAEIADDETTYLVTEYDAAV